MDGVNIEKVTAEAVQVKPIRILAGVLWVPAFVIAFLLRFLWMLLAAYPIGGARLGWRAASQRIERWAAQARETGRVE